MKFPPLDITLNLFFEYYSFLHAVLDLIEQGIGVEKISLCLGAVKPSSITSLHAREWMVVLHSIHQVINHISSNFMY